MDSQTPDRSSGVPGPVQVSPLPQIHAEALHRRVRAHGAADPLDPGLGAPWEAEWKGPPWDPPASPRGPRRFRSFWSPRENRDAQPELYVAGSGRVDTMGFLEPLFQLLWAGALCTQSALYPVSSEHDAGAQLSGFSREELCWGDTHEYRLCQLPDCPPGAMPFRDLQCALYNGHPVLGLQKTYQWVPFYGAPNQCDLNCLAMGHAFYHSFGRVLDGTPCSGGSQELCVAGRCLSAGCDGLMGSNAREDHCGRCGGANDSCLFVQRVFRDTGAFTGYWNVTLIPEGARHIYAAHRSRNHLALIEGDGRSVLNGNWEVSPPGTYEAAGTRVVYTRASGPEETLRAAGPTSQDLILQVLLQEPNPGIEFEFWLPRERYGPFQEQAQALGLSLRQLLPLEVEPQSPEPHEAPAAFPTQAPNSTPDPCPPCPDTRGRAHRLLHYCGSDFVFRARVLGHLRQTQETRYEVRVQLVYKNRSPLQALEYVWAPGRCPCPPMALHREYLLAAQRLISPDGTRDRLLLPHAGYARPWSPAEDSRARLAARHCPV
ncbi:ADAMTS-like protein 5 [Molossus molossus]|uniref:ADAMTS-like protein 5 n=1 Tax=Molossus molossus TaxID=27622 RepID=UPI001745F215|nr:ADAMTS-like protein 5 [Molossus molossus]